MTSNCARRFHEFTQGVSGLRLPARTIAIMGSLTMIVIGAGCRSTISNQADRMKRGYIYYLDGAGGAGLMANWSRGIRDGLLNAGYDGAGEVFVWQTRLGVVADQNASVRYKRRQAAKLATEIATYTRQHPGAPVTIMGLSAGTAIALFALEALPRPIQVDNIILLSSSVSADYDLTPALRHTRNHMYVFTSEHDSVLAYLVPLSGTADRRLGGPGSAGLHGFQPPHPPTGDTRQQYAKLIHIRWKPEFQEAGHSGGHTDVVNPRFVQTYIAPLIMTINTRPVELASASLTSMVRNPTFNRWTHFNPGSWVMFEGHQVQGGIKQPLRVRIQLAEKQPDQLILEWTYFSRGESHPIRVQTFFVPAQIHASEHPMTHPQAQISKTGVQHLTIKGQSFECETETVTASASFAEWGEGVSYTILYSDRLPGGAAQISMTSTKDSQPFEFEGTLIDYHIQHP